MNKKRVFRCAIILLVLVLLISGGYLAWKSLDHQKGAENYETALKTAGLSPQGQASAPLDVPEEMDPQAAALLETDLEALRAENGDVVGWLMIPDTELSYPVVQGEDNQFYLNHTWNGARSSVGAIFMECQCDPGLGDFNTIIYGHRMNNNSMFGALSKYREADFWKAHPKVYLAVDGRVCVYDVFAACEVTTEDIIYGLGITTPKKKLELISFALENSAIDTGISPDAEDQVLTLSTCTSGWGRSTKRWVVEAVLAETYEKTAE